MSVVSRCAMILACWSAAAATAHGQGARAEHPIVWRLGPDMPPASSAGTVVRLQLRARVPDGWYLYALSEPAGGPTPTSFAGRNLTIAGAAAATPPEDHPDVNFNLITRVYEDSARFDVPVKVLETGASPALLVRYQTCNDRYCLPARTDTLALRMAKAPAQPEASPARPPPSLATPPAVVADRGDLTSASATGFLWLSVTMGLLSLLTPCVLPMLPIMVTTFGGAGNERVARRTAVATACMFGIVATFAGVGLGATAALGAGGITRLAANPWLNIVLALLFAAFALNLLGVYEFALPQALSVRLGGRHDGRPRTIGIAGSFGLGAAFAITSFTCTAPLAGTLLVVAAQGSFTWPLIGLTTYAIAFALPFVLLALVPAATRWLPRSGSWMRTVRGAIATIELAAAVKFLSNADLVRHWGLLTRPVVLALWIVAALALAVLFSGVSITPRIPGARRLSPGSLLALLPLAIAFRLALGFDGRRVGELEAYLPPPAGLLARSEELPWIVDDFGGALPQAAATGRPVIVDFTGYTCTNCRWMEANMFPRPPVRALLAHYVRVRLFTDGESGRDAEQQRFEQERFGTVALPFYAILDPQGRPLATFLGMTRDSRLFERFLERGAAAATASSEVPQ